MAAWPQSSDEVEAASSWEVRLILARIARFRNLLVRVYGEVDDNRVWEILQSDLQDLDTYLSAIGEAVKDRI